MNAPLLLPGVCVTLAAWAWPLWQPDAEQCLLGALCCASLWLLTRVAAAAHARPAIRAACLGGCALLLGSAAPSRVPVGPMIEGQAEVAGRVLATSGYSAELSLSELDGAPERGRLRLRFGAPPPPAGSRVVASGRGSPPWRDALPGEPDPSREAALARIASTLKVRSFEVSGGGPRCGTFDGVVHEGLLRALACGDRSEVPDAIDALLTRTGTRHLLAVSGMHVGVITAATYLGVWCLVSPLSLVWRGGRLRWLPALASVAAAWGFAWMTGWSVSAQRAACMGTAVVFAKATGREAITWNHWGLAAMAVALTSPAAVRGASFQLSFGAVAGILLVLPRFTRLLPPDTPRPLVWLVSSVGITAGATAGTLPVSAWLFQELALVAPASNLAASILTTFIVPMAVLARLDVPLSLAGAQLGVSGLIAVLSALDGPVLHPAVGPLGALGLGLAVLMIRRPLASAALATLALGLRSSPPPDELWITFLSVGQGDAALVEVGGRRVLVDAGPSPSAVTRWLRRAGIRHLDAVVLSHPHPDHSRGLPGVLEALVVDALWLPRLPRPDEADFRALTDLAARRSVPLHLPGDPALEVLLPTPTLLAITDDLNEGSLVFRLRHGATSALFTGDIEARGEEALLPMAEPIAWLKVAHHGSRSSSNPALIDRLAPRASVVSCGRGNRYGHPAPEVARRFHPGRLFRTDRDGTVQLRSDGREESWRTWRPGAGWSDWLPLPDRRADPLPPPPPIPPASTLAEAAYRGTLAELQGFLDAGADPLSPILSGDTPLSLAIEGGNLPAARRLYALGAPLDAGPRPPICDAARYARLSVLDWLLALGLSPDGPCRDGAPLHMAVRAWGQDAAAVARLLDAGADPTTADPVGRTPRALAESLKRPLRAQLLPPPSPEETLR